MADLDVKRKHDIYRSLHRMNRAIARLHKHFDWLMASRILVNEIPGDLPDWWRLQLVELQSSINWRLTRVLNKIEYSDVMRFGGDLEKIEVSRIAREDVTPQPKMPKKKAVK